MPDIVFGLSREQDEQALTVFLQRFGEGALLQTVLPRMDQNEMEEMFNMFSMLLRKHLSHEEYHALFLDRS